MQGEGATAEYSEKANLLGWRKTFQTVEDEGAVEAVAVVAVVVAVAEAAGVVVAVGLAFFGVKIYPRWSR